MSSCLDEHLKGERDWKGSGILWIDFGNDTDCVAWLLVIAIINFTFI